MNAIPSPTVQSRADKQSAAIGLLGAISARPSAQKSTGFQAALEEQQSTPGLFADPADQSKPVRADDRRPENTNTEQRTLEKPASGEEPSTPSMDVAADEPLPASDAQPRVRTLGDPAPVIAESDAPSMAVVSSVVSASTRPPTAAVRPERAGATESPSPVVTRQQSAQVASSESAGTQSDARSPVDGQSKPPSPTDPLRLITPRAQSNATTAAETGSQPPAAQTGVISTMTARSSSTAAARFESARQAGDQGIASAAGSAASHSSSVVAGIVPMAAPSSVSTPVAPGGTPSVGGTGGAGSVGATSNSGGPVVRGPVGLDPNPRGRVSPQPVTVRLRTDPSMPNAATAGEAEAASKQLGHALTRMFHFKSSNLTMFMHPDTLGKLKVQMQVQAGVVSARFEATSDVTRRLLEQNVDALRGALESRGLRADRIEIVSIPDWQSPRPDATSSPSGAPTRETSLLSQGQQQSSFGDSASDRRDSRGALGGESLQPVRAERAEPAAVAGVNVAGPAMTLAMLNMRLELDAVA